MSSDDGAAADVRLWSGETLHAEGDEIGVAWTGGCVGEDAVRVFVVMVQRAAWPGVYLTGDEDWCRRAAIALTSVGIPVTNPELRSVIAPHQRYDQRALVSSAMGEAGRDDLTARPPQTADQRRAAAEFETDVQAYEQAVLGEGRAEETPIALRTDDEHAPPVPDGRMGEKEDRKEKHIARIAEDHHPEVGTPMAEPSSVAPTVGDERESFAEFKARVNRDLVVVTIRPFDPDNPRPRLPLRDRKLLRQRPFTPEDPTEPSPPSARPSRDRSRDER